MITEQPQSLEAEQSILSAFMVDSLKSDNVITALESLSSDSFFHDAHQNIFTSISELYGRGFAPDLGTVASHIPEQKQYLVELVKNSTGAANAEHYGRIVKEKALERKVLNILTMAQNTVVDKSMSHNEKFDRVNSLIKEIDSGNSSFKVKRLSEYSYEVVDDVEKLNNGHKTAGLPTGYNEIDDNIGGLVSGELITLGARPSVGKSALGMNIAENVASQGNQVLYITMEMTGKALAGRVICSQGRANNAILKTPRKVDQSEWTKFSAGAHKLASLPIYESSMSRPSVNEIKAVVRNFNRQNQLGLLVIDHLHLMRHDKSMGEVQGIGDTTSELKGLALELDIPVLLMSQLNRGNAKENRPPEITDLRGSGAIEQDSDIVMLIHRDDSEDSTIKGKALVMIPKNRTGEKDAGIILASNLHTYRFDNFTTQYEEF